jgi:hypothetical protein
MQMVRSGPFVLSLDKKCVAVRRLATGSSGLTHSVQRLFFIGNLDGMKIDANLTKVALI